MNICIIFNFVDEKDKYECRIKLIDAYPVSYVKNVLEDSISSYIDAVVSYDDNEQLLRENLSACDLIETFTITKIININI